MVKAPRSSEKATSYANEAPGWREVYDAFVEHLHRLKAGQSAPAIGERFQPLALPDPKGRYCNLAQLATEGPLVLCFVRGGWCPYCRQELESWRVALPALTAAGGRLAIISGEVGGRAGTLADRFNGSASILCDIDHGAALELGLAFYAGAELVRRYQASGLDLCDLYGSSSGFLPVPATFVIDVDLTVRFAFVNPDFRVRAEPADVIRTVVAMRR